MSEQGGIIDSIGATSLDPHAQHCACTKARIGNSPGSAPYDREPYAPLPDDGTTAQTDISSTSSSETMTEFEPIPEHFELFTVIGKGCMDAATITLAKYRPLGAHVAVKRINLEAPDLDIQKLQNEIILCRQLHHENLLTFHCSFVHHNDVWTVMTLMEYGSCKDLIHAYFNNGLLEQAIAYILRDVLKALDYLHARGIIHRSVRASHILISSHGRVCLSGLQDAVGTIHSGMKLRQVHEYPSNPGKSLLWYSPEILEQGQMQDLENNLTGYGTKSDIYTVGITACELANGFAPFDDMPVTQMLLEKLNGTKPTLLDRNTTVSNSPEDGGIPQESKVTGSYQRIFSQHFHIFTDICLEKEPSNRPPAGSLIHHGFFKNLRKKTYDVLPSLLHPVSPISDVSKLPKDESAMEDLTQHMSGSSINDVWNF